jgi:hypothetical protein
VFHDIRAIDGRDHSLAFVPLTLFLIKSRLRRLFEVAPLTCPFASSYCFSLVSVFFLEKLLTIEED